MTSPEEKERNSKRRKKNIYAKLLRDQGDYKGAFSLKIVSPKKTTYKRKRLTIKDLENMEDDN